MEIKTSELTGAALDWAVAKCMGLDSAYVAKAGGWVASTHVRVFDPQVQDDCAYEPSLDWSQGGPIIEREGINLCKERDGVHAVIVEPHGHDWTEAVGPTPLIAAMRCYVASKLGDEVDVPEELMP